MNVLVYSGPGVSQTSLSHTLTSLRALLLPHYAVQTVSPQSLASQPWSSNCALLVLPGGRDLPYVTSLSGANAAIKAYVRNGGAFLGLCAGAYYASKRVEWELGTTMEVSGDRPLGFFGGVSRGCVYPGFQYESEEGAKAITVDVNSTDGTERIEGLYYNGGGEFLNAETTPGTNVLARYIDEEGEGKVAAVACQVGNGKAVLWAIHPDSVPRPNPAVRTFAVETNARHTHYSGIEPSIHYYRSAISSPPSISRITTAESHITAKVLETLSDHLTQSVPRVLKDSNDTFEFHPYENASDLMVKMRNPGDSYPEDADERQSRHIIVFSGGALPANVETPLFDFPQFFTELGKCSSDKNTEPNSSLEWGMGEALLYGEVVTSTQTMLDKNNKLLSSLPTPFLSLASHQLSGRGRGSNTWLSPAGCLQFSLLLRLPLSTFPASKIVFIQYLFALAVVEACRSESVLGKIGEKVRLKWPNDIYGITSDGQMKKLGGILVNTSFTGGKVEIVIGCGINVLNPPPITSLSHLIPPGLPGVEPTMERTAAVIMATFESMWKTFLSNRGSFSPFMDLYLDRWLHSDQLVTLTTTDPPTPVRIVGITEDHGLLRTIPEHAGSWSARGEPYIDLQPDGNSFDLMAGLIRTKT